MDVARLDPRVTRTSDHRDDVRAKELTNLRLALAMFALQLDAFEMRTGELLNAGVKPGRRVISVAALEGAALEGKVIGG
ncbi:MAG TPA: hypothetical protein VGH62_11460 [Bradyrhizobium sp.]|jgi:hypothetical protein